MCNKGVNRFIRELITQQMFRNKRKNIDVKRYEAKK